MQQEHKNINRPLSGSKPKKLIPKPRYGNPSLASFCVKQVFSGNHALDNQQRKVRYQPGNIVGMRRNQTYSDSLTKAQNDFKTLKRQPLQLSKHRGSQSLLAMNRQRNMSTASTSKLNYIGLQSVKQKQHHGYNIINCYPV